MKFSKNTLKESEIVLEKLTKYISSSINAKGQGQMLMCPKIL
jgi:hypothetical protein